MSSGNFNQNQYVGTIKKYVYRVSGKNRP